MIDPIGNPDVDSAVRDPADYFEFPIDVVRDPRFTKVEKADGAHSAGTGADPAELTLTPALSRRRERERFRGLLPKRGHIMFIFRRPIAAVLAALLTAALPVAIEALSRVGTVG